MTGLEAFIIPALTSIGSSAAAAGSTIASAATAAAPYATIASTGLGVAGAVQSANTNSEIAKAQSEQDLQHANAEQVTAQQKASAQERKEEYLLSAQRARFGASGGGQGGTAEVVQGNTAAQGDLNQELELWQGTQQANAYTDASNMKLASAKAEQSALPLTIGSKIVSGVSGLAKPGGVPTFGDTTIGSSYDPDSGFYTTTTKASPYRYG